MSNPSWPIHKQILEEAGMRNLTYPYYKPSTKGLDFDGMKSDILSMPAGSIVVLHVCAHNPTGVDLSENQWIEISDIIKQKKIVPFFDCAY